MHANGRSPLDDIYEHSVFVEADDGGLAAKAWRIHAEGYRSLGFVRESALTSDGFLHPDIDKARGPSVEYFLGCDPSIPDNAATVRLADSSGRGFVGLGGWETIADSPSAPQVAKHLERLENQGHKIKELTGLSRTVYAAPLAVYEVLRKSLQLSMRRGETWFAAIVSTTYESLERRMGRHSLRIIGDDVALVDPRISPTVALRPIVVDPREYLLDVGRSLQAENDPTRKRLLADNIAFFMHGLPRAFVPTELQAFRGDRIPQRIDGLV